MQATVQTVGSAKVTKTGRTYYGVQVDGGQWLNVYPRFNVGDVIEYDEGNLPNWPRHVRLAGDSPTAPIGKDPGHFRRGDYATLLEAVVGIAKAVGITDHQAIAALNNTLLISLQKQGVKIDIESFLGSGTSF